MSGRPIALAAGLVLLGGCIKLSRIPSRELEFDVRDPAGAPLREWWVLSWREERTCFCGFFLDGHELYKWPESESFTRLQLRKMSPADNRIEWPASYTYYVNWGLLLLPPGSACEARTSLKLFAPGHPWGWEDRSGREFPWEAVEDPATGRWRVATRAVPRPEAGERLRWNNAASSIGVAYLVLGAFRDSPDIPRSDLKEFLAMLIAELETLAGHASPDVWGPAHEASRLRELLRSLDPP